MDRAFADLVILAALQHNPKRLSEAIAYVARSLIESGRYHPDDVNAAIDELLAELDGNDQPRH